MYFIYDCETAGKTKEFSILSLFGYVLDDNLNIIDEIDLKFKHKKYCVDLEALKYNGIDLHEHDKNALDIEECSVTLALFLNKHTRGKNILLTQVGHNIAWDFNFIQETVLRNYSDFFSRHSLDLASLALLLKLTGKLPHDFKISLENLTVYFDINKNGLKLHEAKTDVWVTLQIIKKIVKLLESQK